MSQGQVPTNIGYGKPRRRRSLFGPVLLIGIGILFLLRNYGILSQATLGIWFAHWWPLLLIFCGLARLVDWNLARKDGVAPPRFPAGGIALLILLMIFGFTASAIRGSDWNIRLDDEEMNNLFEHLGQGHEFQESAQQEYTPGALVRVNSMQGDINVSTSPDGMIHVAARNVVYGSDDEATRLEGESKPAITKEGSVFVINGSKNGHVKSNLQIELPEKADLDLNTNHGTISVAGIQGNVHAYTEHGNVTLQDLGRDADINIHGDLVRARNVQGAISINGRIENVNVSDAGAVDVGGEYLGSMTVERIQKTVRFHSPVSEMELGNVRGRLFIAGGELSGNDIGGPVQLRTEAKNIQLRDFSGDLSIQDNNGEIELEPKTVGSIAVTDHNGSINLLLPKDTNATLVARTSDGDISSDFPNLKSQEIGNITHMDGNIGAGGNSIQLDTDNSSIEIRKNALSGKKKDHDQ